MDYKKSRIVVFQYQFGPEVISGKSEGWLPIPLHVLNKTKISSEGYPTTLKQGQVKKNLIILQYFNTYYESILGKNMSWVDPMSCFVNDLEEVLRLTDSVIWIFTSPENAKKMEPLLHLITSDVCLYSGIEDSTVYAKVELPNRFELRA